MKDKYEYFVEETREYTELYHHSSISLATVCIFLVGLSDNDNANYLDDNVIKILVKICSQHIADCILDDSIFGHLTLVSLIKDGEVQINSRIVPKFIAKLPVSNWTDYELVLLFLENIESICSTRFQHMLLNDLIKTIDSNYSSIDIIKYSQQGISRLERDKDKNIWPANFYENGN